MEKNSALLRDRPIKVINKRTNLPAWQVLACLGSAAGHVTELTPLSLSFFKQLQTPRGRGRGRGGFRGGYGGYGGYMPRGRGGYRGGYRGRGRGFSPY